MAKAHEPALKLACTIDARTLRDAVAKAFRGCAKKSTIPVHEMLRLTAANKHLVIDGTDSNIAVRVECDNVDVSAPGGVCVPGHTLLDIAKSMPDGRVSISVAANYSATITVAKAKWRLPGTDPENFPQVPEPGDAGSVALPIPALKRLLDATKYAMAADDTRPHLTALSIVSGKAYASDGHRVARATTDVDAFDGLSMLVPARAVTELYGLLDDGDADSTKQPKALKTVSVQRKAMRTWWTFGAVTLSLSLSDEKAPPYDKVIPSKWKSRCAVNRLALIAAIKRVMTMCDARSGGLRVALLADEIIAQHENSDKGESVEAVEATTLGPEVHFGCNGRYLLEALASVQEDVVEVCTDDDLTPVLVQGAGASDCVAVVMPMRLN